jgi:hypothetical protein
MFIKINNEHKIDLNEVFRITKEEITTGQDYSMEEHGTSYEDSDYIAIKLSRFFGVNFRVYKKETVTQRFYLPPFNKVYYVLRMVKKRKVSRDG